MGKKFTKKFPNQVTVFTDRFLEIFASKKYQILLGTGIFMMLSSIYLLANLSYVFSEQKSVIDTQESTIGDGESLLKKLREFDVSTLTQADIEKNPDLDTFMYNQNSYLTTINNLR